MAGAPLPEIVAEAPAQARGVPAWRSLRARAERALEGYPLERIALAALVAGVVLRLAAPFTMDLRADGSTYAAMGHAWAMRHEFLMPWGDVTTWHAEGPGYSHHYPPGYPFYLGLVYALLGFGLWQTKLAAVAVSLAALGAVHWATRDLFGRRTALLATGLVALEPHLLWSTGTGFSENMVVVWFTLTMWALLKSLQDERYVVLAGLFAGLAYLTRASIGYFFFVAGVGGFLWRFHYMRWRVFRNRWYLLAILLFGSIVLAWAARNVALFGWREATLLGTTFSLPRWETSSYTTYIQDCLLRDLVGHCEFEGKGPAWDRFVHALAWKVPLFAGFFLAYALPFLPEARRGLRRIREESESALWLSVFLVFLIAWIFTALFWSYEDTGLWWLDNHRYVVLAVVPLLWAFLRRADPDGGGFRLRYAVTAAAAFGVCALLLASPVKFPEAAAGAALNEHLAPGDVVAVTGPTIKYAFYPYLERPETLRIVGSGALEEEAPDYLVSLDWWQEYPGYEEIDRFEIEYRDKLRPWRSTPGAAVLYAKADGP